MPFRGEKKKKTKTKTNTKKQKKRHIIHYVFTATPFPPVQKMGSWKRSAENMVTF